MKIVLATYGSRGDVQPMLALSLALQSAGHKVLLAGPPEKRAWANHLGCPYYPLGTNLTTFIDKLHKVYSTKTLIRSLPFLRKELHMQFAVLHHLGAKADLLIGSSLIGALPSVAEFRKIPYRYIAFTPQILPSADHPHPIVDHQNLPRWCNRLTWRAVNCMDFFNNARLINKYRKNLSLPPIGNVWRHILGRHVIVASDPAIAAVPGDVHRPIFSQTGYMHLMQPKRESPQLETFIKNGSTPIYAGFGSMPKLDQMECLSIVVNAARRSGRRVVVGKFWDEPSPFDNCDDIFFIEKYPHLDLFCRMAAVIHHGGAGTTATAAICGIPQIIIPHLLDQYYWGDKIHHNGLGPKPIPRSKVTPFNLAQAIGICFSNQQISRNTRKVAAAIRAQESLKGTVKAIIDSLDA